MGKQHYYVKLIGPRPTFPMDITPEEKALMQQHVAYTQEKFVAGKILIYGPVMAPTGPFGMAVFEVDDVADVKETLLNDPSVKSGLNTFEIHAMRVAAAQGFGADAKK